MVKLEFGMATNCIASITDKKIDAENVRVQEFAFMTRIFALVENVVAVEFVSINWKEILADYVEDQNSVSTAE